jgi:hypothetical protein
MNRVPLCTHSGKNIELTDTEGVEELDFAESSFFIAQANWQNCGTVGEFRKVSNPHN